MNYAQKNIPGSSGGECHQSVLNFWEEYGNLTYDVPKGADRKASYIQAFMQQLGNDYTQERMALVQMRINNIKHLVSSRLDAESPSTPNSQPADV